MQSQASSAASTAQPKTLFNVRVSDFVPGAAQLSTAEIKSSDTPLSIQTVPTAPVDSTPRDTGNSAAVVSSHTAVPFTVQVQPQLHSVPVRRPIISYDSCIYVNLFINYIFTGAHALLFRTKQVRKYKPQ